jgi:acid phosphatase
MTGMLELYHRLKNANVTLLGDLAFVNDWDFFAPHPVQQFEQLTTTGPYAGSLSAFKAGVELRGRYLPLLETALLQKGKISIWAGLSDRVIGSARYFASGFFGLDWSDVATLHIIPETTEQGVNTLTPGRSCPKYATDSKGHAHGIQQLDAFRSTYLPEIGRRLLKQNPKVPFSVGELFTMQEICAFEVLLKGASPWCSVFSNDEIESFEYARDVLHYYRAGPGNDFGPSLGWLWLNATSSLLQQGPDAGPLFLSL